MQEEPYIPRYLRELDAEQARLLEKLQAQFHCDCPALLRYVVIKGPPELFADREAGTLDMGAAANFLARKVGETTPYTPSRHPNSQLVQFLRGEISAFYKDKVTGGLKERARQIAAFVDINRESSPPQKLFYTPEQRARNLAARKTGAVAEIPGFTWQNLPQDAEARRGFVRAYFSQCQCPALTDFIADEILKGHAAFDVFRLGEALHARLQRELKDLTERGMQKLEIPDNVYRLFARDFDLFLKDSKLAFNSAGRATPLAYGAGLVLGLHHMSGDDITLALQIEDMYRLPGTKETRRDRMTLPEGQAHPADLPKPRDWLPVVAGKKFPPGLKDGP